MKTLLPQHNIKAQALRYLARREHSRAELQQKLVIKGFELSAIEPILDQLAAQKLQSDRRFAESYTQFRMQRGYGPVRIIQELHQRGVAASQIEAVVTTVNLQWNEYAQSVREKKFGAAIPNDFPNQAKQKNFLLYRGFSLEQINSIF